MSFCQSRIYPTIIDAVGHSYIHRQTRVRASLVAVKYGFCHLLLDELPEFDERSLETLRQPLADHSVTISRPSGTLTFPANFMLIAAMNPCPCGYHGDPTLACTCALSLVTRYQKRVGGPLLDRFDIQIEVPRVNYEKL